MIFVSTVNAHSDGGGQWHPKKPLIASTTNQGNILVWHCPTPERWGAFAGGFEEVDENVEYEEREDEFDIVSRVLFCVCLRVSLMFTFMLPRLNAPSRRRGGGATEQQREGGRGKGDARRLRAPRRASCVVRRVSCVVPGGLCLRVRSAQSCPGPLVADAQAQARMQVRVRVRGQDDER